MTPERDWSRWGGPASFLVALLVRLLGVAWGLPHSGRNWSLHPDEPVVALVAGRLSPWSGGFDPGFYNYGTLPLTLFRLAWGIAPDGGSPWAAARADLLAGRMVSVLAGAGTAWIVWATLHRRAGTLAALVGAAAVAFAPGHVVHSGFMTVDVLGAFFVAAAAWAASEAGWPTGDDRPAHRTRWLVAAGAAAGLAASTKYLGVLALVMVAIAGFALPPARRVVAAGMAVLAALGAFVATTPGILLNPAAFRRDFLYETDHVATGHGLVFAGTSPAALFHIGNLVVATGPLWLLVAVLGFALGVRRGHGWLWGPFAFTLLTYAVLARAEVKFLRYVLPLVPVLALGIGAAVGVAVGRQKAAWRALVAAALLGVGGVPAGGLAASLVSLRAVAEPDPRDEAGDYLRRLPEGTSVALASDPWFYSPTLGPDVAAPRWVPKEERWASLQTSTKPIVRLPAAEWDVAVLDGPHPPQYVAFSSFENEGQARLAALGVRDGRNKAYLAFVSRLDEEYEPDRVFPAGGYVPASLEAVHDMMYVRPKVWVWKRKTGFKKQSPSSSTR